ncbi:hypothetical protein ALC56_03269 [Trachymyrmex septentrionalis]|uniref:Uncharacterized protein n=1 Tax=Trachymyrmex septentrionalis TaxID=34720 RepID=A0A195FNY9_9HYME|nr:hypothetical protein ALC56_03269 [Trachymyrmex septentrionalis]
MGFVSRAKEDDPAGCVDLPQRLKSESNVVFTPREKFSIRANNSDGWDLRKGPSDRENQDVQCRCVLCVAHAQHELENVREEHERERTPVGGATRTTATVSHEREQGDERFLTHAQHELRTVAAFRVWQNEPFVRKFLQSLEGNKL